MTPELTDQRSSTRQPSTDRVTPREWEILEWLTRGKTNSEIGAILDISTRTVSKHLEHIFIKLGVKSRISAVVHYMGKIQRGSHSRARDPEDIFD